MRKTTAFTLTLLAAGTVFGQHAGHEAPADCPLNKGAEPSPYAGFEKREIKALSEDDRAGLLEGRGMGMALAAELNRYPGPKHVLELAAELELLPEQVEAAKAIFHEMDAEAEQLGRRVIELEADLDARFAAGEIDEQSLAAVVAEIGRVRAELRLCHLRAHLAMRDTMTAEQVQAYDRLRGYRR